MIQLKELRNTLKLTQRKLGELLNVDQSQIAKWEKTPKSIPINYVGAICRIFGISPDRLFKDVDIFGKINHSDFGNPYTVRDAALTVLEAYCRPKLEQFKEKGEKPKLIKRLFTKLAEITKQIKRKPIVAFVGKSDVGKSRLINSLTGIDSLVADWTPTTSITVYIKHIDDKPDFMRENVWIYKHGWDYTKFADKEYTNDYYLASGDTDTLMRYGTHNKLNVKNKNKVGSALLFLDSELLKSCNIIDFPGFGAVGGEKDTKQINKAKDIADVFIFLSVINQFMNAEEFLFLKDILKKVVTPGSYSDPQDSIDRFLIVATQAHIPNSLEKVNEIIQSGAKLSFDNLPKKITENIIKDDKKSAYALYKSRFVTYSIEDSQLREQFNVLFEKLLGQKIPKLFLNRANDLVRSFKDDAKSVITDEINDYEKVKNDFEEMVAYHKQFKRERPKMVAYFEDKTNQIINTMEHVKNDEYEKFETWWSDKITEANVKRLIEKKFGNNKKHASEYILSNLLDLMQDKLEDLVESDYTQNVKEQIDHLFRKYGEYINKISRYKKPTFGKPTDKASGVPLDRQGIIAAVIGSSTTLGVLGIWASGLGPLGGYILVAKGVAMLSAIGIGISGGVATAVAFVAAIGGPITLAIGLAGIVGGLLSGVFGESWQKRLSKQAIKTIKEKNVREKYKNQLTRFWNESISATITVKDGIEEKIDNAIKDLKDKIDASKKPEEIEKTIETYKEYKSFFNGLPWEMKLTDSTIQL